MTDLFDDTTEYDDAETAALLYEIDVSVSAVSGRTVDPAAP